jgi:rSAM-associated Gly-rich repeat protein
MSWDVLLRHCSGPWKLQGVKMSNQQGLSRALAALLSGGAFGASLVLAFASNASQARSSQPIDPASAPSVAERLTAIRAAVSNISPDIAGTPQSSGSAEYARGDDARAEPTWWGNGGWGRWHGGWGNHGLGWPNWHNWGNGGWGNGGWGNGGWHNGGWHNYWHNW